MPRGAVTTKLFSLDELRDYLEEEGSASTVLLDLSATPDATSEPEITKLDEIINTLLAKNISRLELDLRYNYLTLDNLNSLKKLVTHQQCPASLQLDLRHNAITDELIQPLLQGIEQTRDIRLQLDLGNNKLNENSLIEFARLLADQRCVLEALAVEHNHLTMNSLKMIIAALSTNLHLKTLSFGVIECENIVQALQFSKMVRLTLELNPHLLALDFHFNFPLAASSQMNRELERELREELRLIDELLAFNNNPDIIHTTIAVQVLSTTRFGILEPASSIEAKVIDRLSDLIPLQWEYQNGKIQAPFISESQIGEKFALDVNRVLNQRKAGFSIMFKALPTAILVVDGLESLSQFKNLETEKARLNSLVYSVTLTPGI